MREFYIEIMHTNQPTRPNGPTSKDIMKARGMLQTHICEYNQANLFLVEVIKTTVTKEQKTFPVLTNFIKTNLSEVRTDAHTLFYAVKRDMLKAQKGYTVRILFHINELSIKVEDKVPL